MKKAKGTRSKMLKGQDEKSERDKIEKAKGTRLKSYIIGRMNIRTILSELLFVPLEQ